MTLADIIAELCKSPDESPTLLQADRFFPQFQLDVVSRAERDALLQRRPGITNDEIAAFTISNKIPQAIKQKDYTKARDMAFLAIKLDPKCFDAYIGLLLYNTPLIDLDTIICGYRELISAMRVFCQPALTASPNQLYSVLGARPYIRALVSLASAAKDAGRLDVATQIYEELIRLDRRDSSGARTPLIVCYLKLIGRLKRVPSIQPVRTIAHLQNLLSLQWGNCPIFIPNPDFEPMKRWAEIFIAWENKGDWVSLAEMEQTRYSLFIGVVLGAVNTERLSDDLSQPGFDSSSPLGSAKYIAPFVAEAIADWPEFQIDLHKKFGKNFRHLARRGQERASNPAIAEVSQSLLDDAQHALKIGRAQLGNEQYNLALAQFVKVKQAIDLMAQTGSNDPETSMFCFNARLPVASNRARCAAQLQHKLSQNRLPICSVRKARPPSDVSTTAKNCQSAFLS
jgi:tetratricopeptide (TPR) repeat protein